MKFVVKAGRHAANNWYRMRLLFGNKLRFRFRIISGWNYDPTDVLNGWSKLFGFACPWVHRNSCRIVWQNKVDGLHIGVYSYINRKNPQKTHGLKRDLGVIYPNVWYEASIMRDGEGWHIELKDPYSLIVEKVFMPHKKGWRWPICWISHPWVGGRFTLKKDFVTEIKLLKNGL